MFDFEKRRFYLFSMKHASSSGSSLLPIMFVCDYEGGRRPALSEIELLTLCLEMLPL